MQPSFTFYKDFGDKSVLNLTSPPSVNSNHFLYNHIHHKDWYIVEKGDYGSGFGRYSWSSMKITNSRLSSGIYTVIFELFSLDENNNFIADDTLLYYVSGDSHYSIITFDHNKIKN